MTESKVEDAKLDSSVVSLFNAALQANSNKRKYLNDSSDSDGERRLDKNGVHYGEYMAAKQ